jgi:hypothetical protein
MTESNQFEEPTEIAEVTNAELLAKLEHIRENTYKTAHATRAVGVVLIYPLFGLLVGGLLIFLGWTQLNNSSATAGLLFVSGALVATGYLLGGILIAHSNLRKSK